MYLMRIVISARPEHRTGDAQYIPKNLRLRPALLARELQLPHHSACPAGVCAKSKKLTVEVADVPACAVRLRSSLQQRVQNTEETKRTEQDHRDSDHQE